MRRLALATAVAAAFVLPTAPGQAYYCGDELADACHLVCEVVLNGRCPR